MKYSRTAKIFFIGLILLLVCAGCGSRVTPGEYTEAVKVCEGNGGLEYFLDVIGDGRINTIYCLNGARFSVKSQAN